MSNSGILFIMSAPSGAGKTSLVKALVAEVKGLLVSISHTTRSKRTGEENGVHYHFVDQRTFDEMLKENLFLEHATVFNHSYGTSKKWVEETLRQGIDIILEIDWQGARQIRQKIPKTQTIFILPPSKEALLERLRTRKQDDESVIQERLLAAKSEISHYSEYDYIVWNIDFEKALQDIICIIKAARLTISHQSNDHLQKIQDMLH